MRSVRLVSRAVSTALATIVIISVLVLSMSWMAYTVLLNAQQQARAAERAETIALKAKELVRVYIWLDPARQPNGTYLNLTRISFVNEWSGETAINGLLTVYRDGQTNLKPVNIRLGAGEERTYLPSELGLAGLDNYDAFKARVRYVQAHTSLGNDFVSLWGRPDRQAVYESSGTGTVTSTITETVTITTTPTTTTTTPPTTTTTNTPPPTTTTTTTVTSTVTRTVTSTMTSTSTVYSGILCTTTVWTGAQSTTTRTVTETELVLVHTTSTITRTATVTVTSTRYTATTLTSWSTYTVTFSETRTVTSSTTYAVTGTEIVTITETATVYSTEYVDKFIWFYGLEPVDTTPPCGAETMVVSGVGRPNQLGGPPGNHTSPEMLLAITGLVFHALYGRRIPVRRLTYMLLSPQGLAVLLVAAVFTAGPVMEAAAQENTTETVTTTVTSTSWVTRTVTSTSYYCSAYTTVTSGGETATVTTTTTSRTTSTHTVYHTSTTTETSTYYSTSSITHTTTYATFVSTTITYTTTVWSQTWTPTWTTSTRTMSSYVTSTVLFFRCEPNCSVWEGSWSPFCECYRG